MSTPLQMRKSQWTSIRTQLLKWYVNKTIPKHLSMQRCHIMLITRETNVRFVIALLWSKMQNILWHVVQKHFRCWMSCNWDHCVWSGITKNFLFFFSLRGAVYVGTVPILALHLLALLNIYSFHGKEKPRHQDLLKWGLTLSRTSKSDAYHEPGAFLFLKTLSFPST